MESNNWELSTPKRKTKLRGLATKLHNIARMKPSDRKAAVLPIVKEEEKFFRQDYLDWILSPNPARPKQHKSWYNKHPKSGHTRSRCHYQHRPSTKEYKFPGLSTPTERQARCMDKAAVHANMMLAGENEGNKHNSTTLRMALNAPSKLRSLLSSEAWFKVIWDSGATISVSFDKKDFHGALRKPSVWRRLTGIARGLKIEGEGEVMWSVVGKDGMIRTLKLPALYVPNCQQRLLSTSSLLQTYEGEIIKLDAQKAVLSGIKGDPTRQGVIALIDDKTNLPTTTTYHYNDFQPALDELNNMIATVNSKNFNLSESEKELLRWHQKLGHLSFRRIQALMRSGALAHTAETRRLHTAASKLRHPPMCAACQYGKQTARPKPGKRTTVVRDTIGTTKKDYNHPGECIAVDHFVCSTTGRLFTSRGRESADEQYCGGAMFVDMATGHIDVEFQTNLTTHDTLQAVERFERRCRDIGVVVQCYLSDNGTAFTSNDFQTHLQDFQQINRFAGAGIHEQNGACERSIRTVMNIARCMMLHMAIHWPEMSDPKLWPMAVQQAVYLYNHMPHESTGISPHDMFTRTRWPHSKFADIHVFGCPGYVLQTPLANGGSIPRWKPRSTRMIHLGHSPRHASTVPLFLNPETGYIRAVFHCVIDDWYATVSSSPEDLPDFTSPEWSEMFGASTFQYPFDDEDDGDYGRAPTDVSRDREERVRAVSDAEGPDPLPLPPLPAQPPMSSLREQSVWREPEQEVYQSNPSPITPTTTITAPPATQLSTWREQHGSVVDDWHDPPQKPSHNQNQKHTLNPQLPPTCKPPLPPTDSDSDDENDTPPPLISRTKTPRSSRPSTLPNSTTHPTAPPATGPSPQRESSRPTGRGSMVLDVETAPAVPPGKWSFQNKSPHKTQPKTRSPTAPNNSQSRPKPKKLVPDFLKPRITQHSKRQSKPVNRMNVKSHKGKSYANQAYLEQPETPTRLIVDPKCFCARLFSLFGLSPPYAYASAAKKNNPDIYTFDECMSAPEPERKEWMESMQKEIRELEEHGTWVEVDASEAAAAGCKVVPSLWTMRVKRSPAGTIIKKKSRNCIRGDLEEGDFQRSSDLVQWFTIRSFLIISLALGWNTLCCDFQNAFCQASLDRPVYMQIPRGFKSQQPGNRCLKLIKSLYGSGDASRQWQNHIFTVFRKIGLKQSTNDPCLWFGVGLMIILYCDDCGISAKTPKVATEFIERLKKEGLSLTVESSFSEYLGIKIEKDEQKGIIKMSQPGLIKKVLEATNMIDCSPQYVPAKRECLGIDPDGEPFDEEWTMPSINGMLLYLATNTRTDIAFAVSQTCRFNHNPKKSHAIAVKKILRYLKATQDEGITVTYRNNLGIDVYCDADFAGLYKSDPDHLPSSAKSRMGYVIFLGGFPLLWKSKLCSEIVLSTTEAEYSALSYCLRDFIPIRRVILEMADALNIDDKLKATIQTTIHEDNDSCRLLAVNQHITSRTKYFLVKWHHWWEWYNANKEDNNKKKDESADNKSKTKSTVKIVRCDTKQMRADYLTKGLPRETFEYLRKQVQGW